MRHLEKALLEINRNLSSTCETSAKMSYHHLQKIEKLHDTCMQIYQGLSDKSKRDVLEESWYKALHDALSFKGKK